MELIRPDRVAIYIRWSTEDQGEGTTLAVQQEACRHFLCSQGWQVRSELVFVDDGYSGGNLRRPALTALRTAVRDGQADCVVCFKLDRLSRSVVDTVNLVLEEWEGRCHFKSAREAIDTTTPAGKMFFYLLASYAEWERNVIRERTVSGRVARAAQGLWVQGSPPYGYRKDAGKRLVIHPAEAAVVRSIFRDYVSGRTLADIVRRLQAEGAPAPGGRAWSKSTLRVVLGNPAYMGVLVLGRRRANPRHGRDPAAPRVVKAAEPLVRLDGAIPPLVDAAAFAAVQKLKSERDRRKTKRSGRACSSPWLLTGVLKCARCGSSLTAHGPHQGHRPYYYCLGRARRLQCDCVPIDQADLDRWFAGEIKRVYGEYLRREQVLALLHDEGLQRLSELRASLDAVRAALADLDRQRAVVRRRFRNDEIDGEDLKGFLADIEAEAEDHHARLRALEDGVTRATSPADTAVVASQLEAMDTFASLDPRDQKHLVFKLVQAFRVYRAPGHRDIRTSVTWRLPPASLA